MKQVGRKKARRRRRDDDAPEGLDDVIRRRLFMVSSDITKTWADLIADVLINAAVGGDLKSLDMLGRRVGAAPDAPAVEDDATEAGIDDEIARRILEAARGSVKHRTHD